MKLKYIVTGNKDHCCGCRACEQACHAAALSMKPDGEGFLYPVFDEARCVDCGLCERVCPMGDPLLPVDEPAEVYAAKSRSEKLCMSSSSGGLFSEIALHVLEKSGAVFGAAFAGDGSVHHVAVESADGLGLLRGSKYVQSDIGDCYSRVRDFLKAGRWVYFVGTPCQVAGLRKFLRKEYDRLLTSDLVCHGVPSQKMFAAYKEWEERRHGGKIREFSFRNLKGWGHSIEFSIEGPQPGGTRKSVRYLFNEFSPYYHGFIHGLMTRPSCYACPYARTGRVGDLTLADYWGVADVFPKLDRRHGVSLLLANTDKGKSLLRAISPRVELHRSGLADAVRENWNLAHPTPKPQERADVYRLLDERSFDYLAKTLFRYPHKWLWVLRYAGVKVLDFLHLKPVVKRLLKHR